jgi:putative NADH-flavin reductase
VTSASSISLYQLKIDAMKITVFGATGTVGLHFVKQALQHNYHVTALTRNGSALSSLSHPNLKIVKGDLMNIQDVKKAIEGADCVVCAIGDGAKGKIRAAGTKNIIEAMSSLGVKRLICQTTLGLGESRNNLNFFWKHVMFGMFLKKAYRDHEKQEQFIFSSSLDWTIVRPSAFTEGDVTQRYKVGFDGNTRSLSLKISRADIADFLIKQVTSDRYRKQAVSISN